VLAFLKLSFICLNSVLLYVAKQEYCKNELPYIYTQNCIENKVYFVNMIILLAFITGTF